MRVIVIIFVIHLILMSPGSIHLRSFAITLLFICELTIQTASAQYNVLKMDLIGIIDPQLKVLRVSYERNIGKRFSASLNYESGIYGIGTTSQSGGTDMQIYSLKGWGLMPEFRFYPFITKKISPRGFFIGTHFRHRSFRENYSGKDYTGLSASPVEVNTKGSLSEFGLHIGYKMKIGPLILEPLLGYGTGFSGGFDGREQMDPFYAEPITASYNMLRIQFGIGLIFPQMKSKEEKSPFYLPSEPAKDWNDKDYANIYVYHAYKGRDKNIAVDIYEGDSLIGKITNGSLLKYQTKDTTAEMFTVNPAGIKSLAKFEVKIGFIHYIQCDWDEKNQNWIFKASKVDAAKYQIDTNKKLLEYKK
jgi:hypothetical protein